MVIQPEQLLESLMDLERSRQRERDIRMESEALLDGLRNIAGANGQQELFKALVKTLRRVLDFEHAFILQDDPDERMTVLATTFPPLKNSIWLQGTVFKRAFAGKPIASYDVSLVPEWKTQDPEIFVQISSALHIGLQGGEWKALLIVTHSEPRRFGPKDIRKAIRFSPLATQAFLTLELQRAIIQRDRFFQLSMDVMAIFNSVGTFHQYNSGWATVLGYQDEDMHEKSLFSFLHPSDRPLLLEVLDILNDSLSDKQLVEVRFLGKNGMEYWLSCSVAVYQDEQLFYFVARDITDRVIYEKRLTHQVGHDALTGLKNRAEFMSILKNTFRDFIRNSESSFAVFYLDLNKFKEINDTLGHDAGDEILKFFARTLKAVTRNRDVLARLGGDEFAILVNDIPEKAVIDKIVDRLHRDCGTPAIIDGREVYISTSIGVAISSKSHGNEEEILKDADLAMYRAKMDKSLPYALSGSD